MTAPSRRRLAWPIPVAAAAAVLLVLVWPRGPDDTGSLHRAPVTASPVPVPLSPAGPVAEVRRLSWTAIAGANRYRATLFDAEGRVLYETQLLDTVAMLPDSVTFVSGRPYLWKVEARTGWDRWSGSELVEFSIASGGVR